MKLRVGDALAVPLGDDAWGFAQVVAEQSPVYFMVAFSDKSTSEPDAQEAARVISSVSIVLAGNFFDVLVKKGKWKNLGSVSVRPAVVFPCYKIVIQGVMYLEPWDRSGIRPIKPTEAGLVEFRANRGPAVLGNALRALHGLSDWKSDYEMIKYERVLMSGQLWSEC